MSYSPNEIYLEARNDELQEALEEESWELAHQIINEVEKRGFSDEAYEMRRDLNLAQAGTLDSEDDIKYVPYQHPEPQVIEPGWIEENISTDTYDERLEQMHLEQLRKSDI